MPKNTSNIPVVIDKLLSFERTLIVFNHKSCENEVRFLFTGINI